MGQQSLRLWGGWGSFLLPCDTLSSSSSLSQATTPSPALLGALPAFRLGACDERRKERGLDGSTGSEPDVSTGGGGLMLCLFLTLCSARDRGTEHGWKVKRGQSVQEMDTTAAAGSRFSCKEVFCAKVWFQFFYFICIKYFLLHVVCTFLLLSLMVVVGLHNVGKNWHVKVHPLLRKQPPPPSSYFYHSWFSSLSPLSVSGICLWHWHEHVKRAQVERYLGKTTSFFYHSFIYVTYISTCVKIMLNLRGGR